MRGIGSGTKKKARGLPKKGRNVTGVTYTVVQERGETKLRCRGCEQLVDIVAWWGHVCP